MPGLVPGIHVFTDTLKEDVDGRDIRAFTPVFDGAMPGHDEMRNHGVGNRKCERKISR
jgi:hypothetical protein